MTLLILVIGGGVALADLDDGPYDWAEDGL